MKKVVILNVHLLNIFASDKIVHSYLKEKVCIALELPDQTTLKKLYYHQPQLTNHSLIRYDVVQIWTDNYVSQMLAWKSQFSFRIMIELYAKLTRSKEEIIRLLKSLTTSSSINPNPINSTTTIIYYEWLVKRATIIESLHDYGLTYKCSNPATMTISYNFFLNKLFGNIYQVIQYGDQNKWQKSTTNIQLEFLIKILYTTLYKYKRMSMSHK